jgi:hypothetical protein
MWIHLFEASLTGTALFVIPLMLIVSLAVALMLFDRLVRKRQPEASRRTTFGGRRI